MTELAIIINITLEYPDLEKYFQPIIQATEYK